MRKSKETLHHQEVAIDAAQFLAVDEENAVSFILGTINGAMNSVHSKMVKAGHVPVEGEHPQIIIRFEAKGRKP